jgi:hypothetical protein
MPAEPVSNDLHGRLRGEDVGSWRNYTGGDGRL